MTPTTTPGPADALDQRLERLVFAGLVLASEPSLEGVLQHVVRIAAEVIGSRYAAIGVMAPDGRLLESFTTFGIDEAQRRLIGAPPRGHGILGLVIREGRPIRLPDLGRHPDSYGFPPNHPRMQSFLGVPITGRGGAFGNLYLTEKLNQSEFTESDEHIAVLLAAMAAAAVENARLHEESARLLAEVQLLQRSRERFFAMVNHELRNALAAVYGWAEMLVRKKDPSTVPRAAFEVVDSAQQAVGLINDLLDLSRLDEDRLKPIIRKVEPAALAQRAIGRARPAADNKRVTVTLDSTGDLPELATDSNRVEQILVNLLTNAIKFTPEGSRVVLSVLPGANRVTYRVVDQGPGVTEADLETIFDIYVTKADEETHGIGLGLPLSRRLARLLGGELKALVEPGGGGVFLLELPVSGA
ncbi:MAG TPA: GAF domain-containing sensor histidine kinase [Gemmatimonadales bacterium]|nr:GAF domain-containing sensor histidine kinase [Gemmatimonadales bacterium]